MQHELAYLEQFMDCLCSMSIVFLNSVIKVSPKFLPAFAARKNVGTGQRSVWCTANLHQMNEMHTKCWQNDLSLHKCHMHSIAFVYIRKMMMAMIAVFCFTPFPLSPFFFRLIKWYRLQRVGRPKSLIQRRRRRHLSREAKTLQNSPIQLI